MNLGGECPFCKQGMQQILREKSTGKFFVECDECMVEWENPAKALKNVTQADLNMVSQLILP